MFSKSSPSPSGEMSIPTSSASSSTFSVIGPDVTVSGDIDATVDLHIDGQVEGDIRCAVLIQGSGSAIKGAVSAEQARIAGSVEGAITAKELIIESGARVNGDVTYEKLSIASGGHVEGNFRYKTTGTLKMEEPRALPAAKDTPVSFEPVEARQDEERSVAAY